MGSDSKPIALEAYEALAERFAAMVETKTENALYEKPATLSLLPEVKGLRVLDAGCGPGVYCQWLLDHGAEVVGVDISPKMIELAKKRLADRVELHLADLSEPLDFLEDQAFDLILSPLALDYVRDWHATFTEFARVLRDGGLLVFSCGHPLFEFSEREGTNYYETQQMAETWKGFGIAVEVPFYRRPLNGLINPLAAAGFAVEKIVEPGSTPAIRERSERLHRILTHLPFFVFVRARKLDRRGSSPFGCQTQ